MENEEKKQDDVTAEEEDPPPWKAGIEEAKRIMKACLEEAHDLYMCYYQTKFEGVGTKAPQTGDQNITNLAVAMYQSIVMMEMERGRVNGVKMQMLARNVEVAGAQLLKPRG